MLEKKRMYVLLDDRKVNRITPNKVGDGKEIIFVLNILIYLSRNYICDWIMAPAQPEPENLTFGDIANHIQSKLIPQTYHKRSYFDELKKWNQQIDILIRNIQKK